jgi:radical SAM superfamily enzyme YgiQ (UPF0313 family)
MRIAFVDNFAFNFGIAHLMPELKMAGHDTHFFNHPFSKWQAKVFSEPQRYYNFDKLADEILAFAPDVVGGAVLSANYQFFRQLVDKLKQRRPDLPVVAGGVLPTMAAKLFFDDTKVDYVYRGEAEGQVCRLFEAIVSGDPTSVPNLCRRTENGFHLAEVVHKVDDLDALPYYDKEAYDTTHVLPMLTGRGCVQKCTYCSAGSHTRLVTPDGMKLIRKRSVDNVLDEIEQAVRKTPTVKTIYFNDDYFIYGREWTAEFAEKYPVRVGLPFSCIAFPASINEDMADLLVKAGCETVYMGFQTGAEAYKRKVLDRHEANERVAAVIELLHSRGIECVIDHILNLPGETRDDIRTSLAFYIDNNVKWLNIAFLNYFPDSRITHQAHQMGVLDDALYHEILLNRHIGEQSYRGTITNRKLSDQQVRWALCIRLAHWLPGPLLMKLYDKGWDRILPAGRSFYYGFSLLTMAKDLGLRAIMVSFVINGLFQTRKGSGLDTVTGWARDLWRRLRPSGVKKA